MTDLPDFLLARIAEDEAVARELLDVVPGAKFRHKGSAAETWHNSDYGEEGVSLSPTRVLAECDAKRQLVQLMVNEVKDARRRPGWTVPDGELDKKGRDYRVGFENARAKRLPDVLDLSDRVLRLLALPYADHPDYNEARRP